MKRLFETLLETRLVAVLLVLVLTLGGLASAPFGWDLGPLPSLPVPVDAIPDYGEAQQIVYTPWPGRSPTDVEDQLTYPLTVALLGVPGVRTVRGTSMFGASMVQVLLEDDVDFYWGRSRVLEKLTSLPDGLLPPGVSPALGPDATALGQIFWYTLEGRDPDGKAAGGFSLAELRALQDFHVAPALASAPGIAEVASVGGYVQEYQIDLDPAALEAYGVRLDEVIAAVQRSNRDVGARTIEVNRVEYVVRGLGKLGDTEDLADVAVRARDGVALRLRDLGVVHRGPALRRGVLDKDGAEAVGGVAVARYGGSPIEALEGLRERIAEVAPSLPERVLPDGTRSRVTIVPFYDRTELIGETLDTLDQALTDEVLVTILVILVLLMDLRASLLVASLLPLAVLFTFLAMRSFGIDANLLSLSGIAIAIGTMVDMGIVVTENIGQHLARAPDDEPRRVTVARATAEVAGAVVTAVGTTVLSFLPVFALQAAEGRLFHPLAWTKTFALVASLIVALFVLPVAATALWPRLPRRWAARGSIPRLPAPLRLAALALLALVVAWLLARHWMPLGLGASELANTAFVVLLLGGLLGGLALFQWGYPYLLGVALRHKAAFLCLPALLVFAGLTAWLGAPTTLGWLPDRLTAGARARMPGLEGEFMPHLDEGSFLYMPSAMPHASIGAVHEAMAAVDRAIASLPEVEHAVGKLGRVESALDPAPTSMIETIVTLRPEWGTGEGGERVRNWRPEIRSSRDVWDAIVAVARTPELTSAPKLQPIETRIVMLQTGMRGAMGVKVRGPDLASLDTFARGLEQLLSTLPEIAAGSVVADRVVGTPYLEIQPDRVALGRYGLHIDDLQQVIEVAIGGKPLTRTIEGREGYPVRIRYPAELRSSPDEIAAIRIPTPSGAQVPLGEVAHIAFTRGPQMVRSEDTFKAAYVTFGAAPGQAETTVVEAARAAIRDATASGRLPTPEGVTWRLAGTWEAKARSDQRLAIIIPLALVLIYVLLHLQFRSTATTLMVFSGVAVALSGGFVALWAWGQPWFLDFSVFGHDMREVFQARPTNISVAVWVGFIALVGIATDDGVLMATYLDQRFRDRPPRSREQITEAVLDAGRRRIRPCLMTTATTVLALLPVLTNHGRGSDVMIPMAIPAFGGMACELLTLFVVPVLYAGWHGLLLRRDSAWPHDDSPGAPAPLTPQTEV
ncbi:MAG: efflux RND transporter permease subunit [Deltaproteobacteria bacterium]|nr:efflux RND transporter permease subunit [Deltaproteobacteria bacterium]